MFWGFNADWDIMPDVDEALAAVAGDGLEALQGAMGPLGGSCGACHDDIDWANGGHPGGITFVDDTQCLDCHGPDATINNGDAQTPKAHEIPAQIAAEAFEYEVVSISDTAPGDHSSALNRIPLSFCPKNASTIRSVSEWTT